MSKLEEVLALFPLLGNSLVSKWLPGHMDVYVNIIQGLLDKSHVQEALSFVPFLPIESLTGKESRLLDGLLDKLFSSGSQHRFQVYQALLGINTEQTTLLERLAGLEEAAVKQDYREPLPSMFRDGLDGRQFWQALHTLSVVAGKHFFEIVSEKAQLAALEGRYSDCALLLRHFEKLAPLVMAMVAAKVPGEYGRQRGLLSALQLSSWRLDVAAWCGSQACLAWSCDEALRRLEQAENEGLLYLIGDRLGLIEDREGLLSLLQHCPEDKESCLRFFALKDTHDSKPTVHQWLGQMRDWQPTALACLTASAVLAPAVEVFAQVLATVKDCYARHQQQEDVMVAEAEFRLMLARRLGSVSALTDSSAQLLLDAAMAGEWELSRNTQAHFKLTMDNCPAVVAFVQREEELALNGRVADEDDFLALADLSFSISDPAESIRVLERAVASASSAAASASSVAAAELLARALVVAKGRGVSLRSALTMSREFPSSLPLLQAWVERENRVRAAAAKVASTQCADDEAVEHLTRELGEESAPLSRFLRYVLVLKRASLGLELSPERVLSELVRRGDKELAVRVSEMLGVGLVDALVSIKGEPISIRELELIAASDPLLAARVALQRQGSTANVELLDFAAAALGSSGASADEHARLLQAVASCRLFSQVADETLPWSLWAEVTQKTNHIYLIV